jgi:hypothetical protein
VSISNYLENAALNAVFNNVALQKSARHLQLHVGDPGEDGTANVATNNTRKSITGAAASAGKFTSVNDLAWTNAPATETWTHVSIWDAATLGNCLWVGSLTVPVAASATDNWTLPAGALVVTLE